MQLLAVDTSSPCERDRRLMQVALGAARVAASTGEVPIGAVVSRDDTIIATAHNAPISRIDPTAHAEVLALRAAARREGNYRLSGATLYVTAEPCAMCVGALVHARIARVVYACAAPKTGALGSVCDLGQPGRWQHRFSVTAGVCADDAMMLLQEFFRVRRGA